ncbi:MAG: hypothetical protein AAF384_20005, partial [Pseudomonadota bacterium]
SEPALKRVGEVGDGWWGVNVDAPAAAECMAKIKTHAEAAGRDASKLSYATSPGIGIPVSLDEVKQMADVGVDQVIIAVIAPTADEYKRGIEAAAESLVVPSSNL